MTILITEQSDSQTINGEAKAGAELCCANRLIAVLSLNLCTVLGVNIAITKIRKTVRKFFKGLIASC